MSFTTAHPLWLLPLCLALGALYAWVLYGHRGEGTRSFGPLWRPVLFVLRTLAVAFLAFFLLRPMIRSTVREVRKPVVVVAHDGSSSLLAAGDTAALREQYAPALQQLVSGLSERYNVRTFTYGDAVREGIHVEQDEVRTDIAAMLREIYDRFAGPDLGAVILDGDGIHNRGRDPRLEADRLGVPIHTIALGDTTVRPDLVLRGVEANRVAYRGNRFPLVVQVEARHLAGRRSQLQVVRGGKVVAGTEVVMGGDPYFTRVPLLVEADVPGVHRYVVSLLPVEGEATVENNRAEVVVQVLDDRQKVLLVGASPHPDLGALRLALGGAEGVEVEVAYAQDLKQQPDGYDLLVLHRLPSTRQDVGVFLRRAAERRVPMLVVMGSGQDVEAFNRMGVGVRLTGAQRTHIDAQATFANAFSLFQVEGTVANAFERFPPLQVPFGQYATQQGAIPLFTQRVGVVRTEHPLILVQPQGAVRSAVICGEGLWRWRLADQQQNGSTERFDGIFRKLARLLADRPDVDRFRIQHEASYEERDVVRITAELYNANLELENGPDVELLLRDREGRDRPFSFARTEKGYRLAIEGLGAGTYQVEASTRLDGQRFTATGEFVVRPVVLERMRTAADHRLLADLAAASGGRMVGPQELGELERLMADRPELAARSYTYTSFSDLVALRWPFFVLLALLSLEWALRRRSGSY